MTGYRKRMPVTAVTPLANKPPTTPQTIPQAIAMAASTRTWRVPKKMTLNCLCSCESIAFSPGYT